MLDTNLSTLTYASPAAVKRARNILNQILPVDCPLPYTFETDDEVGLYWVAGKTSVELSIPGEGDVYTRVTNEDGEEVVLVFSVEPPLSELYKALSQMMQKRGKTDA